jgi:hypothetical protein
MPRDSHKQTYGRNVSLQLKNIYLIEDYMDTTKKGFSKTLNAILGEWDMMKEELIRLKDKVENYKKDKYFPESFKKEANIDGKNND